MRRKRVFARVAWVIAAVVVLAAAAVVVWSQVGVMAAEPKPLAAAEANPALTIEETPEGIALTPADGDSTVGLVFVPGAKVQAEGYVATLQDLAAEQGITVVITRPWLNLAFFDLRGLDSFTSAAPEVDTWIVGGHSLGGVRACQMASFGAYGPQSGDGVPTISAAEMRERIADDIGSLAAGLR